MKNNIVITGGGLDNKGAQSMTFTVVNEMKNRFPDKDIYLLSNTDYKKPKKVKDKYNFNIFPEGNLKHKLRKLYPISKLIIKNKKFNSKIGDNIVNILSETLVAIDISGYNLTSQFGNFSNLNYLLRIKLLKEFNIPVYIFPQSIGPFNYKFPYNIIFNQMIRKYLNYPEEIFVRENHGFDELSKFKLKNVQQNIDTVFYQKDLDINNIYIKGGFELDLPKVSDNSIAIIPNSKLKRYNSGNSINKLYKKIIKFLLSKGKTIYIFRHSFEDLNFCKEINSLIDNRNINLFEEDFNAIELNNLLQKFDYIVGSRYHSIVHAYKNKVPALVIGWAVKYKELTKRFNQNQYCFDIRDDINYEVLIQKLETLDKNYKNDIKTISNKLDTLKDDNIFDVIEF